MNLKTKLLIHVGLAVTMVLSLPYYSFGQVLPFGGGTYAQDFNGLQTETGPTISAGTDGPFGLDTAWQTNPPPILTTTGMNGWQLMENGKSGFAFFTAGSGSGTTSGAYSYGANGSSDRALGAVAGSVRQMAFGAVFRKDTGITIPDATIAFTGEQWRLGRSGAATPADTLFFEYRVGLGSDISTAGGAFTSYAALNFITPTTVGTVGALNGNDPANQVALSSLITGLNWQPNEYLVLRWRDIDEAGSDHGIAIDDFSITAIPEPSTVGLVVLGGMALGSRRWRRPAR